MSLKPVPFKILGFSLLKKKDKWRKLTSFEESICIQPQILPGHKIGNVFSIKNMFLEKKRKEYVPIGYRLFFPRSWWLRKGLKLTNLKFYQIRILLMIIHWVKRSSFRINHWYCRLVSLTTAKMNLYRYTVEMTDGFKGLDLIDRAPEELYNTVQETVIKTIPMKKKCKKVKWLSEDALQKLRKEEKQKAKERRKDTSIWMQSFRRIARRDKRAFLSKWSMQIEENNKMGKMRDLFKKLIPREHFMQRRAQ